MDAEQEQRYIIDRVGEETDLEECSLCFAASCFACVSEHCTALKKLADGGCVFYKDAEENLREIRKCFYRLIQNERFDLLMKYAFSASQPRHNCALFALETEYRIRDG